MIELVIRLVFSLAVVIGLLLLVAKVSSGKFRGATGSVVRVVHRQPLSRTSAVAVVTVGSRVLVLGTTEQHVQLLTELDPDDLDGALELSLESAVEPEPFEPASLEPASFEPVDEDLAATPAEPVVRELELVPRRTAAVNGPTAPPVASGALAGSVLSAQTWKQALAAAEATRLRLSGRDRDAS